MPFITKPNAKKAQDRKNRNRKTGLSKNSCTIYHKKNASAKSTKSAKKSTPQKLSPAPNTNCSTKNHNVFPSNRRHKQLLKAIQRMTFQTILHKNCPIIYLDYKTFSHVIRPKNVQKRLPSILIGHYKCFLCNKKRNQYFASLHRPFFLLHLSTKRHYGYSTKRPKTHVPKHKRYINKSCKWSFSFYSV